MEHLFLPVQFPKPFFFLLLISSSITCEKIAREGKSKIHATLWNVRNG